ncbi:adenine-specific DNA methylase, partial [mine drainage metagenome]
ATTLATLPERALVNDINPHPINCYRWIQKGLRIDLPLINDESTFYEYRHRFNALIRSGEAESKEAAELFYYLNRTCFNGLCRFNRKGEFNVPFGKYSKITYVTDFRIYRKTLRAWEFMSGDFETVPLEPDDFIYADPPYDVNFTQYSRRGSDGAIRFVWLSGFPVTRVRSYYRTKPRPESRSSTASMGFPCASFRHLG